jgi:ATP adenylyltransferase
MKQLHAPWRMTYILSGEKAPECIFCAFPARGRAHFREHLILCAQPRAFVIMNKYPYGNGHLMVVPRRHVAAPAQMEAGEWAEVGELVRQTVGVLGGALACESFNVGMNLGRAAGAGIDQHLHWHVVPRWHGDTNFMPLLSETRVISEHLEATYDKLVPAFAQLGEGPA